MNFAPLSPLRLTRLFFIRLVALLIVAGVARAQSFDPPSAETKKGFGTVARPGYAARLRALNVKWFYSWGTDIAPDIPFQVEFVPMVWGYYPGPKQDQFMQALADKARNRKFTTLLGFNEPEGKDQANMSVQTALDAWPKMMAVGVRLGSPAGVHADSPWMKEFMHGVDDRHLRVDFITVHWYGGPNADAFLGHIDHVHQLYGRPIWITEFCPADWSAGPGHPNHFNAEQVREFLRKVIPGLKGRSFVERFAWYSPNAKDAVMGYSALFNEDGSLTELGQMYASY